VSALLQDGSRIARIAANEAAKNSASTIRAHWTPAAKRTEPGQRRPDHARQAAGLLNLAAGPLKFRS